MGLVVPVWVAGQFGDRSRDPIRAAAMYVGKGFPFGPLLLAGGGPAPSRLVLPPPDPFGSRVTSGMSPEVDIMPIRPMSPAAFSGFRVQDGSAPIRAPSHVRLLEADLPLLGTVPRVLFWA